MSDKHIPTNITYHSNSHTLELEFNTGEKYQLSAEYLRVNSPSAEVQGHGPGQEVLQIGKQDVKTVLDESALKSQKAMEAKQKAMNE